MQHNNKGRGGCNKKDHRAIWLLFLIVNWQYFFQSLLQALLYLKNANLFHVVSVAMFLTIHAVGKWAKQKKPMKYKSNFQILILSVLCEFKYSYLIVTILFIDLLCPNFYSFLALQVQEEISAENMGVHETCNTHSSLNWVFRANVFVCWYMHACIAGKWHWSFHFYAKFCFPVWSRAVSI